MKINSKIDYQKKSGFTLIELLVVVSIIGVLTALLLANFVGIRGRAKDSRLKGDLEQMKTALRLYYNDNQQYPTGASNTFTSCSGAVCVEGSEFNSGAGGTVYMKKLPAYDLYSHTNGGDGFYLGITLGNASDSDIAASKVECGQTANTDPVFFVCQD